jgi:hypothetical protein
VLKPLKPVSWDLPAKWPIEEGTEEGSALLDPFCCVVCVSSGRSARRHKEVRNYLRSPSRSTNRTGAWRLALIDQMPERLCRLRAEAAASIKLVWLVKMCNTVKVAR